MKIKDQKTGRFIHAQSWEERFWEKVDIKGEDECWEWKGYKNKGSGHGEMTDYSGEKPKGIVASRVSWQIHYGEIPSGLYVCHHCDNGSCMNPKHLFLGTPKDNTQDMIRKGRKGYNNVGGERHGNARLKNKDVIEIRKLWETGRYTQIRLGKMFKVGSRQICYIVHNQSWKNI